MKLKKLLAGALVALGLALSVDAAATCSNYTTYVDGQVLTASSLNSLQTNYTNCVNAVLDGDTLTGTLNLHSGADINVYSDTGSTLKASLDGATGKLIAGIAMQGYSNNCGISNASVTLSLHAADGSALSATNPCIMGIRSNTAGYTAIAFFTSNQTITHGATSDSDGNVMGLTSTVHWASTMPMFGGVVYDGTTPYIVSARLPFVVTGAAATAFCQKGDTDCDAQLDMIIWTTGLTLASWVNLPVTQFFWFDATYSLTGEAWTFAVTGKNGFNQNYEGIEYNLAVGQMGAEATKVFTSTDGGTALAFSATTFAKYYVKHDGTIVLTHTHNDQSAAGADGTTVRWAAPFSATATAGSVPCGAAATTINNVIGGGTASISNGLSYATVQYANSAASTSALDSSFANTNDFIFFTIIYQAM